MNTHIFLPKPARSRLSALKLPALALFAAGLAIAGRADEPAPSQNPTINLVRLLVQQGVITQPQADVLIGQAEAQAVAATQAAQAAAAQSGSVETVPGRVRVPYIPETVKAQMREEIKQEVMAQAREENWAAPRTFPEWTSRFRPFGDVRFRYEGDFFSDGNDNTGGFPDFNAINSGSPYDASVSNLNFPPMQNVDADRQRARLRARFGVDVDLGENFTVGTRIATGSDNSPVSTNQSMGGSGGFSKYSIWLDRAFLQYEMQGLKDKELTLTVGRLDNPFFSTDLIWDDDLGFDGIAARYRHSSTGGFRPFATLGLFPVYNTSFNYSSNQPDKMESEDKWLHGAQIGADWEINDNLSLKVGAAYYHFDNIEGRLSTPYTPLNSSDAGDTDATRPAFAQKGNTYMALRNIVPDASNGFGTTNQWQYYGLATPFRELALTARLDIKYFKPFHISVDGEVVKNLAYDEGKIAGNAVNNRGPVPAGGTIGAFEGGDMGWLMRVNLGDRVLEQRWDWQVNFGYKYVESDAVVDGLTDSDFGLGGTNLQGYFIGANVALSKRVSTRVRWLSADEIAGTPFAADVFQFDINAKF